MGLAIYDEYNEVERDYDKKLYEVSPGVYKLCLFSAHKHYLDDQGQFQEIDQRLIFDDKTRYWGHNKASYWPSLPEYADGEFGFRNKYLGADFTLIFKPLAAHVLGKYFEDADGSAYVYYAEAFGKGIHLTAYSYAAGVKKVITVEQSPLEKLDLTFDFEIVLNTLEDKDIVKSDNTIFSSYKVAEVKKGEITTPTKAAALDFTDATIRIGKDGYYTYFRNALMWDSANLVEKVPIQIISDTEKVFIRKTIPIAFIEKATFPIFTDHPTSFYGGSGDGNIYSYSMTLDGDRNATTGIASTNTIKAGIIAYSG